MTSHAKEGNEFKYVSRISRLPIELGKVTCAINGQHVELSNGAVKESYVVHDAIEVTCGSDGIQCHLRETHAKQKEQLGTAYRNLANIVIGLTTGFSKTLKLVGVGYKVEQQGQKLIIKLGKSHDDIIEVPADMKVNCPDVRTIEISGVNKQKVGHMCAEIIKLRPPDAYHAKGVQMVGRHYSQKEVKKS